jgi:DNA-binding beta-propeller fold protein YncE
MKAFVAGAMAVWMMAAGLVLAGTASHEATGKLGVAKDTQAKRLSSFCLNGQDNIVAADEENSCLRVISPGDKLVAEWKLDFAPQAVTFRPGDGAILVAGCGKVAAVDSTGKVTASGALPVPPAPKQGGQSMPPEVQKQMARYNSADTAVASSGDDVFVCGRSNTGYAVYRLGRDLQDPKPIITGLRGCCGQMDVTAKDGVVYVAANCESKVQMYDREGKKTGAVQKQKGDTFWNGCCEPKNVAIAPDGTIYVAESAQCSITHFAADGKFLGTVGAVKDIRGCVRVTVAVAKDGKRIYMLDTDHNSVRVFTPKA